MSRVCACGCEASLVGLRSDAVWASDACRKRAQRAASPDKARTRNGHGDAIHVRIGPCLEFELPLDWPELSERFWAGVREVGGSCTSAARSADGS
jgi:hypothetical protein